MKEMQCGTVSPDRQLNAAYWEARYQNKAIGWDLGKVSPPLQTYVDTVENKNTAILIPGCGNSYEAEYLLKQGFTNITVIDFAPTPVADLKEKFRNNPNIQIVLGDFFAHQGHYDLILEQTFFCALPPFLRQKYVWKMHQLLADQGKLVGILFNKTFQESPPFGGSKREYEKLFAVAFDFLKMEPCPNSIASRADSELCFELQKNNNVSVTLYEFAVMTGSDCPQSVTKKIEALDGILNVSISTTNAELLLVSKNEIAIKELQNAIDAAATETIKKIS